MPMPDLRRIFCAAAAALLLPAAAHAQATVPIDPSPDGVPQMVDSAAPEGWQPDPKAAQAMRQAIDAFLALRDKGDRAGSYAMLTLRTRANMAAEYWMEGVSLRGPLKERAIRQYSWYLDPAGAAEPGLYLAADFVGSYANAPVYCGYVMAHRARDGKIGIARIEENVVLKEEADRAGKDGIKRMIAQMPC